MKLIYFIFFFLITIFSNSIFAKSIAVVNVEYLIDNNVDYNNKLNDIENDQQKYLKNFELKEIQLKKKLKEIEDSKLLLNDSEINDQINNYNDELNEFTILIESFNLHYQEQIIKLREILLKEIINLLEKYAIENKIELILDSRSYLIASNSIDITTNISSELEKIKFKLEFKNFEKN